MNLAIVTKNLCAGGTERVISQLMQEWVRTDSHITVSLILLEDKDDFYDIPNKVNTYRIGRLHINPVYNKALTYLKVRKLIYKLQSDVVLSLPEEIGIYVLLALIGTKTNVVVSERNNPRVMPYKKITRLLRKIVYPQAKGIIFQSEEAANFFPEKIRKKSVILKNPLDLSRIPEKHNETRNRIIVGAGRLEKQKDFITLINAFSLFSKEYCEYKLIIYGDGEQRTNLENYAKQVLRAESYEFPGRNKNLLEDISNCEIFVLSSTYEGLPNVLIEAMACGMAVVSTDYEPGGVNRIITNGKNGLVVAPGDYVGMAKAMIRIVQDQSFGDKIRKNAAKIQKQYDSRIVSSEWLDYLKAVSEEKIR